MSQNLTSIMDLVTGVEEWSSRAFYIKYLFIDDSSQSPSEGRKNGSLPTIFSRKFAQTRSLTVLRFTTVNMGRFKEKENKLF